MSSANVGQDTIRKAIDGDLSAFKKVVETHQTFVYAVAYRFVPTKADAEDITQETFIRLWKNIKKYNPEIKLTTWLYKIVTNLCLDLIKSRDFRQMKSQRYLEDHLEVRGSLAADESLIHDELKAALNRISEELTPKQKVVFVLRDMEGLPVNEVAEILSMSEGNIKSNLYYARLKVSEGLRKHYQEQKKESL